MIDKTKIPASWTIAKLGEVCENIKSGYPCGNHNSTGIGYLHFRPFNININGAVDLSLSKFVPLKSNEYILKEGDVIFNNTNSPELLGKTCFIRKANGWVYSNHMTRIRVKEYVNPEYCASYLHYLFYKGYYRLHCSNHVNQASISSSFLNKFVEIPLPPLFEQHRIVSKIEELFSELDKGVESLKTAQQQLKIYRQAVLKWAFEGRLTHENVKDGELPEGWKWNTIRDVCTSVEYGSTAKSKEKGKVPVLRMGNIQNGRFYWSDLVYTDDDYEIKKYLLKKDDVLFNRTNSPELVGKTAIYKGEQKAIFAGYLIRINRIESLIDADYLNYYLNTHAARTYGNSVKSFGVNQSNINGTKLKTYPIPIPTLPEQKQIVSEIETRLSVCGKLEETITTALQQSETLRQGILKKAFEGKLVEQNPEDEPATKLLERIKVEREKDKAKNETRKRKKKIPKG